LNIRAAIIFRKAGKKAGPLQNRALKREENEKRQSPPRPCLFFP
jgi:hypothetical protein